MGRSKVDNDVPKRKGSKVRSMGDHKAEVRRATDMDPCENDVPESSLRTRARTTRQERKESDSPNISGRVCEKGVLYLSTGDTTAKA
mmetsp:Transcript_16968/g.32184  ORF Transcript_16968/g.32184 Transcript_16968/m.32184 type:complete len:87 (+) Transcript_16968:200-460(+)